MPDQSGLDIATLGIRVDAREVQQGAVALDNLERVGARAERRFITLAEFDARRARTSATLNRALRERAQTEREVAAMMTQTATATEQVGQKSRLAGAPIARLNNSMVVLARQAAGAHPVVGQLADAVGTFAIGTAKMVPVLAGLAAIAVAIRTITRESREARTALAEAREELDRLAPDGGIGRSQAAVQERFNRDLARYQRLRRYTGQDPNILRERDDLFESLFGDAERLSRGRAELDQQRFDAFLERARERLQNATAIIEQDMRAFDEAFNQAQRRERIAANAALRDRNQVDPTAGGAPLLAARRAETKEFDRQVFYEEKLLDLEEQRMRANDALIRSLENVGRAYGGVVDQVLALAAATFSIAQGGRLPFVTNTDRAIALGTSGLTGAGFGFSTGSPGLGGIGGGIAGGLAAGPAGAIVGAVGGIVGGLIESGRRAEEASRVWRRAFVDFRDMFADLSPLDQQIRDINRIFEDLVAGLGFISSAKEVLAYEKLVEIRDKNIELAREQADAERDLYDARFRAFNAPSGFNAQFYGAQFGAPVTDTATGGSGGDVNVTININDEGDPDHTATMVVQHIERFARRGGYSFSTPTGR